MAFSNVEEFKAVLASDVEAARTALNAWENELRKGPPDNHQAAHDAWQVVFACDALLHAKDNEANEAAAAKAMGEAVDELQAIEVKAVREELGVVVKRTRVGAK